MAGGPRPGGAAAALLASGDLQCGESKGEVRERRGRTRRGERDGRKKEKKKKRGKEKGRKKKKVAPAHNPSITA